MREVRDRSWEPHRGWRGGGGEVAVRNGQKERLSCIASPRKASANSREAVLASQCNPQKELTTKGSIFAALPAAEEGSGESITFLGKVVQSSSGT